jgi:HEPN domain-containing protein
MSLEYVSAQDKLVKDGLIKIRGIDAYRKTLARSFFEFGETDLYAYTLLKESLPSIAIFHLQQAIEKVAKAMLILDMNDIKYDDLKNHNFIHLLERFIRKHDEDLRNINSIENALFRQALTYASPKFLDFLKSNNTENREIYNRQIEKYRNLYNKIARLKQELDNINGKKRAKLEKQIEKEERKLIDSGLLTNMVKGKKSKKRILCAKEEEIKSFITQDNGNNPLYIFSNTVREALLPFFNILFLTVITYPHEEVTRYPDDNGLKEDYKNTGIFKASGTIYYKLSEIKKQLENLDPYSEIFNK